MALFVWLVIAFIIVSVMVIIKLANEKQAIAIKLLLFIFVFILLTAGYVYIKFDVDVSSFSNIMAASKIYLSWLGSLWESARNVVGYAVHQDWSLNATNISK